MSNEKKKSVHWVDIAVDRVLREKGDKELYTCASGITPSGTVHVGNFREIISVALVAQGLKERGKNVRFIYSWDDYDTFRKVPKNMPNQELLESCLRMPITQVPDTLGNEESYARSNEVAVEKSLPLVGIFPEYLYQSKEYGASKYAEGIRTALEHRDEIREILNSHRTSPLEENWWPISIFSEFTKKDTTTVLNWDGEWNVTYRCDETAKESTLDLRTAGQVKLLWRIDWPMRWAKEGVDCEPAGKDHHSQGGSFDTCREIVPLFGGTAPSTFQYDFVRIKGGGGKMSSSSGEVVSLKELLKIYTPELIRYQFVGTRPNSEFAISFDLDVLKTYEDYDNCERIYFGVQEVSKKREEKEKRNYELSQVGDVPSSMPYQVPFRHLCNLLQIQGGDIEGTIGMLGDLSDEQKSIIRPRCICAWNWITTYAPEDFRFALTPVSEVQSLTDEQDRKLFASLIELVKTMDSMEEKPFSNGLYDVAREVGVEPVELFTKTYRLLIGKEKGPRLASFMQSCTSAKVLPILEKAISQ